MAVHAVISSTSLSGDPSTSTLSRVTRLALAVLFLLALTLALSGVLHAIEAPAENERMKAQKGRVDELREVILERFFDFLIPANQSPLYYSKSNDACRRGDCAACFSYGQEVDRFAQETDAKNWYGQQRWLELQNNTSYEGLFAGQRIYVDTKHPVSHFLNATHQCTEHEITKSVFKCVPICHLQQPTVTQVSACAFAKSSPLNPVLYNAACLTSSPDCPNCHLLRRKLTDLRNEALDDSLDPNGEGKMQTAALYVLFKKEVESYTDTKSWTFASSVYFSTTILSTIGYGNFTPEEPRSQIIIMIFGVPMIAAFGVALKLMSLLIVDNFADSLINMWKKVRARIRPRPNLTRRRDILSAWRGILEKHGIDLSSGQRSFAALRPSLLEIMDRVGATDQIVRGRGQFLNYAFEQFDENQNGMLDEFESVGLVMEMRSRVNHNEILLDQRLKFYIGLGMTMVLYFGASVLFWHLESSNHWTFLQSLYFVFITLTTIGLGDFTPSPNFSSYTAWYCVTLVGLGLFAFCLNNVSSLFESTIHEVMATHKFKQTTLRMASMLDSVRIMSMSKYSQNEQRDESNNEEEASKRELPKSTSKTASSIRLEQHKSREAPPPLKPLLEIIP